MKNTLLIVITLIFALSCADLFAEPFISTKIMPESVDYPMVRTKTYRHTKERTRPLYNFEMTFGARRWLDSSASEAELYCQTMQASGDWNGIYGGYGCLGRGEEVFTVEAAAWRKQYIIPSTVPLDCNGPLYMYHRGVTLR
jgi:hypothetical protein